MSGILITGGDGRLGTAIRRLIVCHAPKRESTEMCYLNECRRAIRLYLPDVVIHCASYTNAAKAETDREACWRVNVDGTRNMVRATEGRRFVYISTDYVFDGLEGNYSEGECPYPVNFYGMTKLIGEQIVLEHPNTLVLRVPFRADPPWKFPRAFVDQWTSCRFASEVAPDVIAAALSTETGILHIGGPRRSIYEMAESVGPVGKMKRSEFPGLKLPRDTSLNSSKWHSLKEVFTQSSQAAATLTSV